MGRASLTAGGRELQNVAVNVAGSPVLPPVVSPGAAVSLHGRAWHSYWVERRN